MGSQGIPLVDPRQILGIAGDKKAVPVLTEVLRLVREEWRSEATVME